jgi:hypothetical protein
MGDQTVTTSATNVRPAGRASRVRYVAPKHDLGTREGIAHAFSTDAQFVAAWRSYAGRNAGARDAEPAYGRLVRVYVTGRSIAHLTDVADDEPVEPLCSLRGGTRRWRGRTEREELRALDMRLCRSCRELAELHGGV